MWGLASQPAGGAVSGNLIVFGACAGQKTYNIASWAQLVLFVHLSSSGVEGIVGLTGLLTSSWVITARGSRHRDIFLSFYKYFTIFHLFPQVTGREVLEF